MLSVHFVHSFCVIVKLFFVSINVHQIQMGNYKYKKAPAFL